MLTAVRPPETKRRETKRSIIDFFSKIPYLYFFYFYQMKNKEEENLQVACVRWFEYQYPKLSSSFFSYPIDGYHQKRMIKTSSGFRVVDPEGARKKRMFS